MRKSYMSGPPQSTSPSQVPFTPRFLLHPGSFYTQVIFTPRFLLHPSTPPLKLHSIDYVWEDLSHHTKGDPVLPIFPQHPTHYAR